MDKQIIIKIAKMHYLEGMTYNKISKKLNISNAYISKLLKVAKNTGIVEIRIVDNEKDSSEIRDLSIVLTSKFKLKDIFITSDVEEDIVPIVKRNIGEAASLYLYENLEENSKLGITWGTTISIAIDNLRNYKKRNIKVGCIQLLGNLSGITIEQYGVNIVTKASEIFGGDAYLINAPSVVDNNYIKEAIVSSLEVKRVFEQYGKINFSISGVGSLAELANSTLYKKGYLTDEILKYFKENNIVGDVLLNFYTINGEILKTSFDERKVGISLKDYKKIPNKIVVSAGLYKAKAIYGAIKAGLVDILITDFRTAKELRKLNH